MQEAAGDVASSVAPAVVRVTGAVDALVCGRGGTDKRFHSISDAPRSLLVAGASGVVVRKEARPDSPKVGEVPRGAAVAYTGRQASVDGKVRVEVSAPLAGWISLKLCAPLPDAPPPPPPPRDTSELE